ncbi:MAG: hypothetical protein IPM79_23570 [Polyangiaceae bacterium]|nr:hypothetical protein [Polyangiaceae bacterium]
MAPEQIRGQVPDPRVDVFALGCVLYHALAGAPPFTGGNTLQLLTRILLEEPAPLEAVAPSGLAPLIGKMMGQGALRSAARWPRRPAGASTPCSAKSHAGAPRPRGLLRVERRSVRCS